MCLASRSGGEGPAIGEYRNNWVRERRTPLKLEPNIWDARIEVYCQLKMKINQSYAGGYRPSAG